MNLLNDAIGGYFALELQEKSKILHEEALKYQSARAAFSALLENMPKVDRIWMPAYICESMLAPIKSSSKESCFYNIDEKFNIISNIYLKENDLLLYVNYFGVCESVIHRILDKFNPKQIIIDCSQAFFSRPYQCLATIYSPRKFFGIPDGGLIFTSQKIQPPNLQDTDSVFRMEHLITRLAISAEAGYASYKVAEASLDNHTPKIMSRLTSKLLKSIDYETIQEKRINTFLKLSDFFQEENQLNIDLNTTTPLCYPLLSDKRINRDIFSKNKIFFPTYWVDAASRVKTNSFEAKLINNLIPIPIDQRYSILDLSNTIEIIKKYLCKK